MKRSLILLLSIGFCFSAHAQQPPNTEIYLFDLSVKKSRIFATDPQNVTQHPGYDNQPFFHPDKPLLYFASANEEGKTEIMEYDMKKKQYRKITNTSDREYSPTVTPDKKFLSCIIQRDNGAQNLGKYPITGGEPIVLIDNLTIGYHAWIDAENLLLFVLGDTMSLHQYNLSTKKDLIVAKAIGRSLHKIPKTESMSYVSKISEKTIKLAKDTTLMKEEWYIKKINRDGSIETIVTTLQEREDLAWMPDGTILMGDGKKIFYYQPGKSSAWMEIEMPVKPNGAITRLAVNAKGNKLAVVVSE